MVNTEIIINNKTFNCRLGAKACILCERALGRNPLNVLAEAQEAAIPKLEDLLTILKFAMGVTEDEVYELYDQWVEEGHSIMDLLEIVIKVFENSGLVPKEAEEDEKN